MYTVTFPVENMQGKSILDSQQEILTAMDSINYRLDHLDVANGTFIMRFAKNEDKDDKG